MIRAYLASKLGKWSERYLLYFWDKWQHNFDDRPIFFTRNLIKFKNGMGIDLHKFVNADTPGCYHTHPAYSFRFVLWGGYVEEVLDLDTYLYEDREETHEVTFLATQGGLVRPNYCHLIKRVIGSSCYTLWFKGPRKQPVWLNGTGWPKHLKDTAVG